MAQVLWPRKERMLTKVNVAEHRKGLFRVRWRDQNFREYKAYFHGDKAAAEAVKLVSGQSRRKHRQD